MNSTYYFDIAADAERHYLAQEAAGNEACASAAILNGLTAEQAENCNDCEYGCPTCPWINHDPVEPHPAR